MPNIVPPHYDNIFCLFCFVHFSYRRRRLVSSIEGLRTHSMPPFAFLLFFFFIISQTTKQHKLTNTIETKKTQKYSEDNCNCTEIKATGQNASKTRTKYGYLWMNLCRAIHFGVFIVFWFVLSNCDKISIYFMFVHSSNEKRAKNVFFIFLFSFRPGLFYYLSNVFLSCP